jgi:hypothetical protein
MSAITAPPPQTPSIMPTTPGAVFNVPNGIGPIQQPLAFGPSLNQLPTKPIPYEHFNQLAVNAHTSLTQAFNSPEAVAAGANPIADLRAVIPNYPFSHKIEEAFARQFWQTGPDALTLNPAPASSLTANPLVPNSVTPDSFAGGNFLIQAYNGARDVTQASGPPSHGLALMVPPQHLTGPESLIPQVYYDGHRVDPNSPYFKSAAVILKRLDRSSFRDMPPFMPFTFQPFPSFPAGVTPGTPSYLGGAGANAGNHHLHIPLDPLPTIRSETPTLHLPVFPGAPVAAPSHPLPAHTAAPVAIPGSQPLTDAVIAAKFNGQNSAMEQQVGNNLWALLYSLGGDILPKPFYNQNGKIIECVPNVQIPQVYEKLKTKWIDKGGVPHEFNQTARMLTVEKLDYLAQHVPFIQNSAQSMAGLGINGFSQAYASIDAAASEHALRLHDLYSPEFYREKRDVIHARALNFSSNFPAGKQLAGGVAAPIRPMDQERYAALAAFWRRSIIEKTKPK